MSSFKAEIDNTFGWLKLSLKFTMFDPQKLAKSKVDFSTYGEEKIEHFTTLYG